MLSVDLMKKAVKCADDKKALDIKVLNIGDLTTLADYFVICHAPSNTQMNAIYGEREDKLEEEGVFLINRGSHEGTQWLLMDYGDVVVHIFNTESREFYGIEKLWADAKEEDISDIIA